MPSMQTIKPGSKRMDDKQPIAPAGREANIGSKSFNSGDGKTRMGESINETQCGSQEYQGGRRRA